MNRVEIELEKESDCHICGRGFAPRFLGYFLTPTMPLFLINIRANDTASVYSARPLL